MVKFVLYRRACDWQCEESDRSWDGWVRGTIHSNKESAKRELEQLRKEDCESSFKLIQER
jgi:hypothetical protein